MLSKMFEPKTVTVLREGYNLSALGRDALAGIIVGVVAIPLSIAFAIASGVKPEQGLVTAVVAGLIISVLSGSRVQIGGPTGAFIIIVLGIVQQYGYDGLALATLMAGAMLVVMGLARMGDVIKYIPYPVTVGFTSGIALVIFTTQVPDFLGLTTGAMPKHFLHKWAIYLKSLGTINPFALLLGLMTILTIIAWPRVTKRVPGTIVAIIATTLIVQYFQWPVDTITDRFGEVPNRFPAPHWPELNFTHMAQLVPTAITIALLAGIESLLSAVVADGMIGTRHRSNMELVAQGAANLVTPLFGGIPATGAIARTATNIKNGGRSPVAGVVHALTVLVIFLFFGKWAGQIPVPTLAGILIVVSYNMSEMRLFARLLKSPREDMLVLLITFGLTILVDLTVAIEVGVVLAALLFMHRMAALTRMNIIQPDDPENGRPHEYDGVPEGVEIFEINGPFFFGAADKFRDMITTIKKTPKVIILRMSQVPAVDSTAASALENLIVQSRRTSTQVILAGVSRRVFSTLKRCGIIERIGRDNVLADVQLALARAIILIEEEDAAKGKAHNAPGEGSDVS